MTATTMVPPAVREPRCRRPPRRVGRYQGIDRYHRPIDSPSRLWSIRPRYRTSIDRVRRTDSADKGRTHHAITDRRFEIEFLDPGVETFAFTFG